MTSFKFTIASIKMFFRNKQGVFWSLFLPIMIMVIFGLMNFGNMGKANLAIVDQANNDQSKQVIEGLKKVDILTVKEINNEQEAKDYLAKGDLDLVMIIPKNFLNTSVTPVSPQPSGIMPNQQLPDQSAALSQTKPTNIPVYYNQGKEQQAATGLAVLDQTFDQLSHKITNMPTLFVIDKQVINSRNLNYIDFLVPGIIAMAIMQMGVFSIIFVLVNYREKGIMKRLLVTPMRPIEFISGQVLTRLIVSILQVAVILSIAILIFKINMVGSYFLVLLLVLLGALLFISMGFAMSSFAKTQESAAPIANIIIFPMLFLSGVFFPIQAMPQWLQNIAYYFPLRFLASSLRSVMTEGATLWDIRTNIYWLIAWSMIMIILAIIFFNFGQEE